MKYLKYSMHLVVIFLCSLGWLQPLHILPWVSWHSEVTVFFGVCLATGCALVSRVRHCSNFEIPHAGGLLLGLLAIVSLQTLMGAIKFGGSSVVFALYISVAHFALALGFGVPGASKQLENIAIGIAMVGVASVVIALMQAAGIDISSTLVNPMESRRPGGNLGQANHLATLLLMSLVSVGYLKKIKRISVPLSHLVSVLLAIGVAITESRAGFLSFIVVFVWQLRTVRNEDQARKDWVSLVSYTVFFLFWWVWPSLHDRYWFVGDGASLSTRLSEGGGIRVQVWQQLLDAATQRPWLGWGLGNVAEAHNAVLDRYSQAASFSYAHNVIIDLAVGIGFPLTICFAFIAIRWLIRIVRIQPTIQTWYAIGALIPVAVHSLLEFPFAYAYFLFPGLYFLGVIERERAPNATFRVPRVAVVGLFVVVVSSACWSVVEYVKIEEDFRVARFEALHVGVTPGDYHVPEIRLLTQLSSMLQATRVNPTPGMSQAQLESLRMAAMYYPWTAIQNRYALALALNGSIPEAQRQLKVMRVMHGDKVYEAIQQNWHERAEGINPQLLGLAD